MKLPKTLLLFVLMLCFVGTASAALDNAEVYYSLDDDDLTGSNPDDLSGNNNDGTNNGATTGVTGILEQAFSFDGSTDYVDFPFSAYSSGDLSFGGWINIDSSTSGFPTIIGFGNSGGTTPFVALQYQNSAGNIRFVQNGGTGDTLTSSVTESSWHHVVAVRDSGTLYLYIDGTQVDTQSADASLAGLDTASIGSLPRSSRINYWNGELDETFIYQRALSSSEVNDLYNSGSGFNPYAIGARNFTVTAIDDYTTSSLTNFSALINGTEYTTTNGTITTPILDNSTSLYNITISSNESGGYFNRTYTNYNVSSNLGAELHQAEITFYAENRVSGASVHNFTVTAPNNDTNTDTNPSLNVTTGEITYTFNKTSYYDTTTTANLSALETSNATFNVYDQIANFTINTFGSATDQNFTLSIYSDEYNFTETISTTNGYIEAELTTGNYTVYVNDSIHALTQYNLTLNNSVNITDVEIDVYTTNSVNITFIDELTNELINETVTAYFTGNIESYNYTTSNGTLFVELLEPDSYTITYNAPSYEQREYEFTLSNRTTNELTLYLINSTEDDLILVTVTDTLLEPLADYTVRAQRKNLSGTNYYTVETCNTDNAGECVLKLQLFDVTYRFLIENSDEETVLTSSDQKITTTNIAFQIDILQDVLENIQNKYKITGDVSYETATNNFQFVWNDPSGLDIQGCLEVKSKYRGITTEISDSCTTGSSGTITYNQEINDTKSYEATGYVLIEGERTNIDALSIEGTQKIGSQMGLEGLFIFGFLILGIAAFTALFNPVAPPAVIIIGLIVLNILGFISVGTAAITGLGVVGVIIIYLSRA